MIVDTHVHLNDERYTCEKIEEIVNNFSKNNIEKVISVGYDKESSEKNIKLSEKFDNIYSAVGVHPSNMV